MLKLEDFKSLTKNIQEGWFIDLNDMCCILETTYYEEIFYNKYTNTFMVNGENILVGPFNTKEEALETFKYYIQSKDLLYEFVKVFLWDEYDFENYIKHEIEDHCELLNIEIPNWIVKENNDV